MKIVIYASELAGCVGMHRYVAPTDVALKVFQRSAPDLYAAAHARSGVAVPLSDTTRAAMSIEAVHMTGKVKELIRAPVKELDTGMSQIIENAAVSDPGFADDLKTFVYTERGKIGEKAVVDDFERQHDDKFTERNDKFFKKKYALNDHVVIMGGRVDGLSKEGRLIEVKNRQRRFFQNVPLYEQVQIMCYQVLTGAKECELIQCFDGESRVTVVPFDEKLWEDVETAMLSFADKMFSLLGDNDKQDELVTQGHF